MTVPTTIEIINSDEKKAHKIRDFGLYNTGGVLTLAPLERVTVPLAVWHRNAHVGWLMSTRIYDAQHPPFVPPAPEEEEPEEPEEPETARKAARTRKGAHNA